MFNRQPKPILAKFSGRCKVCGNAIEVGWRIQKHPMFGYVHVECIDGTVKDYDKIRANETYVQGQARGMAISGEEPLSFTERRQAVIRELDGKLFAPLKAFFFPISEPWRAFRFTEKINLGDGVSGYTYQSYLGSFVVTLDRDGTLWHQTNFGWEIHPNAGLVKSDILNDENLSEMMLA